MALWNMVDANTGAPKYAPYSGLGVSANGSVLFDNVQTGAFVTGAQLGVFGVDAHEKTNTAGEGPQMTHAGWVARKLGTGGLVTITITAGGAGYANGFLTVTGGGTSNTPANVSYTVNANGVIISTTINTPGSYTNTAIVVTTANANSQATFTGTVGGRAGRREYITLVAAGSMASDLVANTDDAIVGV